MSKKEAGTAAPTVTRDEPTIWRVDDALWAELQPALVVEKPRKKPGRPRHDDRPIFDELIWIARSGGQWKALPREFETKSTVNDRYLEWVKHGCFAQAWARLLAVYDDEVGRDWPWPAADGCLVQAPRGNKEDPARRRRPGAPPPSEANAASSGTC